MLILCFGADLHLSMHEEQLNSPLTYTKAQPSSSFTT